MTVVISPTALKCVAGFHACLDAVAHDKRYLAQTQAPAADKGECFVCDSVYYDATQMSLLLA